MRNLLFFGNSFTFINDVPSTIASLAVADGHTRPHVFLQWQSGWTLANQLKKLAADGSANIINRALPAGAHWDDVIVQDGTLRPTGLTVPPVLGDVAGFRADTLALVKLVHQQSPDVHTVMYETWARGPRSSIYPLGFASPLLMQNDLRASYALAAGDINGVYAPGAASVAPVGEAWKAENFARDLYNGNDEYHSSQKGSVLAALVLYRTIYHENTTDIPAVKVAALLAANHLSAADWRELTMTADRV